MEEPRSTRSNAQVLEEASGWFVEFKEGEVDNRAREEFSRWLRTSPEHVRAYLQISALWEDAPHLVKPEAIDVETLIARAREGDHVVPIGCGRASTSPAPEESNRPASFSIRFRAVAAALLVACTL